ncbi:MAG: NAD(P)-dependent alcohol dehydrogenase [Rhodothermales bacterium]
METAAIKTTNDGRSNSVDGFAAMQAGQRLEPYRFAPGDLRPMDVEIDVTHCGLCHTDLHLIDNDWGMSAFPFVPGHEVVGTVSRIGSAVTELNVGQRVGVGFLAGADFTCDQCAAGRDNFCENWEPTCLGREGGFAQRIHADSRLAFPIPENLASEHAAPLMCAGVTVFAPLLRYATGATRLGVVGIGGLGHLALQYGRALGCHVTAFSTSPDKEDEARALGADHFVDTSPEGALTAHTDACDLLLCTVTADVPWNDYLGVLRRNGKLCLLGVPDREVCVSAISMIFFQRSLVSSGIGSRWEIRRMLDFSARHGIAPQVELFPMSEVNAALDRLRKNEVRYRAVLTTA